VDPSGPTVPVAVPATPTVRPTASAQVYVYSKPAPVSVGQKAYSPASPKAPLVAPVAPAQVVAANRPASGTWVLDPNPYSYTPAVSGHGGGASAYLVTR